MFVSEFSDSGGQRGQGKDKCVKREGDWFCGVGDGTRRSSLPESRGKNWFQTELQRHTSHGRRGRGLGVSLSECRDGNLAGELCHLWGGLAIC